MARIGVPANLISTTSSSKGTATGLQIDKAEDLMREMMEEAEIQPDVISYNTLIDGCILVDDCAGALSYFNEMRRRGIAPTKVSYTTLMKAFASSGQPKLASKLGLIEEAKSVMEKMKEEGMLPNVATYGSLANGIALARNRGKPCWCGMR
ncbi:hypothetical protein SASPL_155910 [Salvia splendens]|uniref:Pentatricopeptide repeat-containing protein n=1 Tax=Salvia splendens TaxID=180675 RepID=A0A8X8VXN2_SALSN|nr:hypothetical protein SASPL_155910 [Salvia splendens]